MNRIDLQKISRLRVKEARALLQAGYFQGAYYLLGYSLECAIKACIAKQVAKHDFPVLQTVKDSHIHDLAKLLRTAGLYDKLVNDGKTAPALSVNWAIAKDWSSSVRYQDDKTPQAVKDFFSACTSPKHGILNWLKKSW